ncbi:hypothetical protein BJ095_1201 [Ureibacillus chungkukjangi]|uniref:Uncharacterized protein n=1 Tax=Ureibacillus chungkukjangi TaxID=1202712 RepID=A0A318TS44_9BACL|nr:hypothetical protein BJ095_1201 [Ureibacillus chungkukjangi]
MLVLVIQRFAPHSWLKRRIVARFTTFRSSDLARSSHYHSLYDVSLLTPGSFVPLSLALRRFTPQIWLDRRIVTRFTTFGSSHPPRSSHCHSLYDVSLLTSGWTVALSLTLRRFAPHIRLVRPIITRFTTFHYSHPPRSDKVHIIV